MDPAFYDELQRTIQTEGPARAIDRLCDTLRRQKDYGNLFYALLMKKRHELGVSPVPTDPASELPAEVHEPYEQAIRAAGELVGRLYLEEGNIPYAWSYFRMLGEPAPVREALDRAQPREQEEIQPLVDIALYQGVHPCKGFDLVLEHYGICNAITTLSGQHHQLPPEAQRHCLHRLVRALHDQLVERLQAEIAQREGNPPSTRSIPELLAGRDWLFEDELYHVDISHLSSVVQMSLSLPPGEGLDLARELCAYGARLSPRLKGEGDPPFDDTYTDYGIYLDIVAGRKVEEGLAHFRQKAEQADPDSVGTYPAEVLVNLLVRLERLPEALDVARRFLARADDRQLSCPSIAELCRRTRDYQPLADVARQRDDPVHFLAGLIAGNHAGK